MKMTQYERNTRKMIASRLNIISNAIVSGDIDIGRVLEIVHSMPTIYIPSTYKARVERLVYGTKTADNTASENEC